MPNYHDAYISDVFVTIDETPERSFDSVCEQLKTAGLAISSVDKDQCVVEGTVEAGKVCQIDDMPGVEYVRTVFSYVADFPPGDPRDLDQVGRESSE